MIYRSLILGTTVMALVSCSKPQSGSDLKITKGEEIADDVHEPVRKVSIGSQSCTGTFITKTRLLTAAHCAYRADFQVVKFVSSSGSQTKLEFSTNSIATVGSIVVIEGDTPNRVLAKVTIASRPDVKSILVASSPALDAFMGAQTNMFATTYSKSRSIFFSVSGKRPAQVRIHPSFEPASALSPNDLATLDFAEEMTDRPVALATSPLANEAPVLLAGYGNDSANPRTATQDPAPVRRLGRNVFQQADQTETGFIRLLGAVDKGSKDLLSSTAHGDSGGPLLDASGSILYGVTTGGVVFKKGGDRNQECDSRLTPDECTSDSLFSDLMDSDRRAFVLGQ